jgi:hypothetical protein
VRVNYNQFTLTFISYQNFSNSLERITVRYIVQDRSLWLPSWIALQQFYFVWFSDNHILKNPQYTIVVIFITSCIEIRDVRDQNSIFTGPGLGPGPNRNPKLYEIVNFVIFGRYLIQIFKKSSKKSSTVRIFSTSEHP